MLQRTMMVQHVPIVALCLVVLPFIFAPESKHVKFANTVQYVNWFINPMIMKGWRPLLWKINPSHSKPMLSNTHIQNICVGYIIYILIYIYIFILGSCSTPKQGCSFSQTWIVEHESRNSEHFPNIPRMSPI